MADRNLYKEKNIKNQQEIENSELKKEIEKVRNKLDDIVARENNIAGNEEILEVSKKLDELIVKYLKNER